MENSKRGSVSMQEKPDYRKSQGAQTPSEVKRMQRVPYALAIGSIILIRTIPNLGYVFMLNGGAVDWKSGKQSTIAMPSTEAEYTVVAKASMEAVWIRKFIDGLGYVMPSIKRPMEILCDNAPAITIANYPRVMKGARHYQRNYHYIREVIQDGEIVLKKVDTDDNLVDPFTKPMPYNKHFEHAMAVGLCHARSGVGLIRRIQCLGYGVLEVS
ncbi:hypothetical protein Tco_0657880 [Tanacetum coccineum]